MESIPNRHLAPTRVSVNVKFAGANYVEALFAAGFADRPVPWVPGIEASGRIREQGLGVSGLTPGEPVAALTINGGGAYGQVAVTHAALVAPLPPGMDPGLAAAVPANTTTALLALERVAYLHPGEDVLVQAAAGGFGSQLGQIARLLGAGRVVGVVGHEEKRAAARELGYDEVWLRSELDDARSHQFDVIADPVAGPYRPASLRLLRLGGRILALGDAAQMGPQMIDSNALWLGGLSVQGFNLGALGASAPRARRHLPASRTHRGRQRRGEGDHHRPETDSRRKPGAECTARRKNARKNDPGSRPRMKRHPNPTKEFTMKTASRYSLSSAERWRLVILLSASFTLAVDFSVLNVALPQIGREIGISPANLQWVITSFALPAAGLGLFFGRLGDLIGRRLLFMIGIILLGAGSILGGVASTETVLIVARVIQGVGTAAIAPTALSLLISSFEEGPRRARALSINGALLSAGFTTGALLGGVLSAGLSWRAAFLINVPVTLVVLVLTPILFTESRPRSRPRLDIIGAALISSSLSAIVYGLSIAGRVGLGSPEAYVWLAIGLALLGIFLWAEARTPHPLIAVSMPRRGTIAFGNLAGLTTFAMMSGVTYLLTLYFQDVLGYGAIIAGLLIGAIGLVSVIAANFTPRIINRYGQKNLVVGSLVLQAAGTLIIAAAGVNGLSWIVALIGIVIAALGHIGTIVGYTVVSTSNLPEDEHGLASGLTTTSQQIGLALGTPLLAAIMSLGLTTRSTHDSLSLHHGLVVALTASAIFIAASATVIAWLLPSAHPRKRTSTDAPSARAPEPDESLR